MLWFNFNSQLSNYIIIAPIFAHTKVWSILDLYLDSAYVLRSVHHLIGHIYNAAVQYAPVPEIKTY